MSETNVRMTFPDAGKYVAVWSREQCFRVYCLIFYAFKQLFIHTAEVFQLLFTIRVLFFKKKKVRFVFCWALEVKHGGRLFIYSCLFADG